MAAHPLVTASWPAMTDEEAANFAAEFQAEAARGVRVMPPRPVFTPEEIRVLLRECVTVVKPGEVLVIRVSEDMTPNQVREYQDMVDAGIKFWHLGIKAMVLRAQALGIAEAAS